WSIGGGRPTPDGGLDLCLETRGTDAEGRPLACFWDEGAATEGAAVFPSSSVDALIVDYGGNEGFAFTRGPGGFERVAASAYELDVDCRALPAEDWNWTLQWSWRGIRQTIDRLGGESVGERRLVRFSAPGSGSELRWLASEARQSS